jgi:hypothetical protein
MMREALAKLHLRAKFDDFDVGFEFFANRLWPIGYVNLRKTAPTSKSSNLALKASFARASRI